MLHVENISTGLRLFYSLTLHQMLSRIHQGLFRLRLVLRKVNMAEVSEGIVATSSNNKTSQDGVEVVVDKRSLGSDGQVDSSQVTAEAEPAAKKLKTELNTREENLQRIVKRKVAMMLAYSGVGYKGMQKNPGEKTIEDDLASALVKCQAIPPEHGEFFGKMAFQRCARTDKGVSAAGQVVSLKMILLDNIVEKINEYLPPCIRVMGIKRTTASFNSKHNCDYRTYMYMVPTFAFEPIEQITTESYRITVDKLKEVNDLLAQFVGTHNFHNFTSGKAFKDPSANRFIREFTCDQPFIQDGMQFVIVRVKGQSFMLHQIRKMVGLVIAIAKGFAPHTIIERAFNVDKLDIPKAPGLGLVLESVHYEAYSKRWGNDGMHEPLTWDECQDKVEAFKREEIYPTIIRTEKKQRSMMQWLTTLTLHTYDVIGPYNPIREAARDMENSRREAKERLSASNNDSEQNDQTNPQDSTSSHLTKKTYGGSEVTSTTTQELKSKQDSGLEGTSTSENKSSSEVVLQGTEDVNCSQDTPGSPGVDISSTSQEITSQTKTN
ncbi:tRNA pseudouridine synthase A-like isoform X2 [Asterias rubens]|uniref:tRNA pseudouridine synthase A-like isoform X2 n=1 Tax=Asterias rubens TaxID=7604 RepID=UPI0014554A56|nr:tRNA pseudouridine synthase A-like isoform X2 [Asterias rubens]